MKSRILETKMVDIDEILFNPKNWRVHPKEQQDAISGLLNNVGWVQFVTINATTGNLIDGHARVQIAARNEEKQVPAVMVELSEEEEKLILATMDSTSAMATVDQAKYAELANELRRDFEGAYNELLTDVSMNAFHIDLQPMFESGEINDFIAGHLLVDELEQNSAPEFYYEESIKIVKLEIAMLPEEKKEILEKIGSVAKSNNMTIVQALLEMVRMYEQ